MPDGLLVEKGALPAKLPIVFSERLVRGGDVYRICSFESLTKGSGPDGESMTQLGKRC